MRPCDEEPAPFLGVYSSIGAKTLGQYMMLGSIADAGMGLVYNAFDTTLGRRVVVKALPPWEVDNADSRRRLREEARLASSLDHPNIVRIYELVDCKRFDLIVMEYVPGDHLGRVVGPHGLPIPKALRYGFQLADALAFAHSHGVVHRDLKPSNVIVDLNGRIRLIDFGLSLQLGKTANDRLGGSTIWLAPEERSGRPETPDPRSEMFSFGLLLHKMLGGGHPYGPGTQEQIADSIGRNPPGELPAQTPKKLSAIVARCLAIDPAERLESMECVVDELQACGQSCGLPLTRLPGIWTSIP